MTPHFEKSGRVGILKISPEVPITKVSGWLEEIDRKEEFVVTLIHIDGSSNSINSESEHDSNNSAGEGVTFQHVFNKIEGPVIFVARGKLSQFYSELAIFADLCLASEESTFLIDSGLIESILKSGLPKHSPGIGALLPTQRADPNTVSAAAAEMADLGLVNFVLPESDILAAANDLAATISANAPLAMRACKKAVNIGYAQSLSDGMRIETEEFVNIFSTSDAKEGTAAFLEKRTPVFTGK